jgi:general secretion pathway protein G
VHGCGETKRNRHGVTLIELIAVVAIIGILSGMASQRVSEMRYRAEVAQAIGDVRAIGIELETFLDGDSLPASLAEIGRGDLLDPWGQPYVYFPFPTSKNGHAPPSGARRDRFLVPINSTYDLYSVGRDGASAIPLTAKASHDDIVRGNDGGYIGLGSRF